MFDAVDGDDRDDDDGDNNVVDDNIKRNHFTVNFVVSVRF